MFTDINKKLDSILELLEKKENHIDVPCDDIMDELI